MNNQEREEFQPTSISDTYSTDTGLGQAQTLDRLAMINNFVNKSEIQHLKDNIVDKIDFLKQRIEDLKASLSEKHGEVKERVDGIEDKFKTFTDRFWVVFGILTAILFVLFLWLIPYLYNKENSDNIRSINTKVNEIEKKLNADDQIIHNHDKSIELVKKILKIK